MLLMWFPWFAFFGGRVVSEMRDGSTRLCKSFTLSCVSRVWRDRAGGTNSFGDAFPFAKRRTGPRNSRDPVHFNHVRSLSLLKQWQRKVLRGGDNANRLSPEIRPRPRRRRSES